MATIKRYAIAGLVFGIEIAALLWAMLDKMEILYK